MDQYFAAAVKKPVTSILNADDLCFNFDSIHDQEAFTLCFFKAVDGRDIRMVK
jgi:hypothetical protein